MCLTHRSSSSAYCRSFSGFLLYEAGRTNFPLIVEELLSSSKTLYLLSETVKEKDNYALTVGVPSCAAVETCLGST